MCPEKTPCEWVATATRPSAWRESTICTTELPIVVLPSCVHTVEVPSSCVVANKPTLVPTRYTVPPATGMILAQRHEGPSPEPVTLASRFPATLDHDVPPLLE